MIERAKKHIDDLTGVTRAFFDSKPYKVGTRQDPQSRRLIYVVASVEEVPTLIPVIAGDAIQNLRSALDHLAYQLYLVGTNGSGAPAHHVYFPVGKDAAKYHATKSKKVQGMRQDAIDAIDVIEPYKGGKGHHLWVLSELNNAHKHRLLVTVGSAFRSLDLGAHAIGLLRQMAGDWFGAPVPTLHAFYRTSPMMCPLKAGDELFSDAPDAEVNEEMQFCFDIAFSEPGLVEGETLGETLHKLVNLVEGVVTQFESML